MLSYAGADCVGSLHGLRPHAAEPSTPVAELGRTLLASAMADGDPLGVAEQRNVARLAYDPVQPVELGLSSEDHAFDGLLGAMQRAIAQDMRPLAALGVESVDLGALRQECETNSASMPCGSPPIGAITVSARRRGESSATAKFTGSRRCKRTSPATSPMMRLSPGKPLAGAGQSLFMLVVVRLGSAHHSLAPLVLDHAFQGLHPGRIESVERPGRKIAIELRTVSRRTRAKLRTTYRRPPGR
jgi:hypothetical protein